MLYVGNYHGNYKYTYCLHLAEGWPLIHLRKVCSHQKASWPETQKARNQFSCYKVNVNGAQIPCLVGLNEHLYLFARRPEAAGQVVSRFGLSRAFREICALT